MLSDPVDLINFLLDLLLIFIGIWMAVNASLLRVKGALGGTMRFVTIGSLILGVAHLAETVLDQHFHVEMAHNELIHRVIIMLGFLSIAYGLSRLTNAIRRGLGGKRP